MVHPVAVCRRQADPLIVQKLWTSIKAIRTQKQVANPDRLVRQMQREYSLAPEEVERQLNFATADRLISIYRAVSVKGSNTGSEQDAYRIQPADENERMGDHDWYCYDCHRPGSVLECAECWRVFHPTCVDDDTDIETDETFVCAVCKDVKKQSRVKRKELNRLLGFTVLHLKDKLRDVPWSHEQDVGLERFVYHYVDFDTMQSKTEARKYKYLEQFYADARTILHNVFVCFGDSGIIPDMARLMIRDCRYDLDEIRQCKDCYFHSNARMKDWFCQPCNPAHELVYAKQKGFSYWPAKIIKVTQEGYDVRFFGGLHQRALIPAHNVKPLDASPKVLQLKRTAGFIKASKELERHQELLEHGTTNHDNDDNLSGAENDMDDIEQDKSETKLVIEKQIKIRHKKVAKRRRSEELTGGMTITSSGRTTGSKSLGALEDSFLVTSSEDKVRASRVPMMSDARIQTSRKLAICGVRGPHKSTQTDESALESCRANNDANSCAAQVDAALPPKCTCDARNVFSSLKDQLESEHDAETEKAMKALEDRLRKDFEEDKQRAVARAISQAQRDVESARRQAEDKCKEEFVEEMKKVVQKHKTEISATKKKQWCYNCEEEAMYHCCWNTSYCSIKCQQDHWHIEHKRMCRRKRN